ncbi:MAG: ATP-binding protein [Phocaeicola sp.]
MTTESIKQPHISYPYNPIIADVLFKTTFLENWGSGTGRIMDACKAQNVEIPTWSAQGGFIIVCFRRETEEVVPQVRPNYSTSSVFNIFDVGRLYEPKRNNGNI